MTELSRLHTSIRAGDRVSVVTFGTIGIGSAIAKALAGLSAKAIAAKLRRLTAVSARTVESWKQARRAPRAEHVLAMLSDDELCALLLAEVNPALAIQAEILATKKKLKKLEAKQ